MNLASLILAIVDHMTVNRGRAPDHVLAPAHKVEEWDRPDALGVPIRAWDKPAIVLVSGEHP